MSIDSDGRKAYTKGFNRKWVVDSGNVSLEFLTTSLGAETSWGRNQKVVFWVFDKRSGEDVQLDSDSFILDVLDMYEAEKHFVPFASVFDQDIPATYNAPLVPPILEEGTTTSASNEAEDCDQAADVEADEVEPNLPDVFDKVEEYVGVDDEYMYVPVPNVEDNAQPQNDVTVDNAEPPTTGGAIPTETEVTDADPQEIVVLHNPRNPDIRKGALCNYEGF